MNLTHGTKGRICSEPDRALDAEVRDLKYQQNKDTVRPTTWASGPQLSLRTHSATEDQLPGVQSYSVRGWR